MNPAETGKAIASLRKEAGYTQAALAEALEVSDKAVSKWERGLACPDISLLPKLSILLDTDIEGLFNGEVIQRSHKWKGILILDTFASSILYTKPLVYFLLQNFLLIGIKDISIIGGNVEKILGDGSQYGIRISYFEGKVREILIRQCRFCDHNIMMMYGNALIYGANLTRKYQAMMIHEDDIVNLKTYEGKNVPILFCPKNSVSKLLAHNNQWETIDELICKIKPVSKFFARGVVALPVNNYDEVLTASSFVQIIEKNGGSQIADLNEIAKSRGLKIGRER